MGTYAIDCTECSSPFMWWSGNPDQRCPDCKQKALDTQVNTCETVKKEKGK